MKNTDFEIMVNNAYSMMENNLNVDKLVLPKINIEITPSRVHWKNIKEFLKVINREPNHFIDFLKSEMSSYTIDWISGSKSDGILFQGKRLKQSNIEDIMVKYVSLYVVCSSCKKTNTFMIKQPELKKYKMECNDCHSIMYL